MGGDALGTLGNIAGRAAGVLGAITSIKYGGLGNFMNQRARMMADPAFRAQLEGSPFTAGFYQVGGGYGPVAQPGQGMPGAGGVVPPSDFVGPPAPGQAVAAPGATQFNVPGYEPGTPRAWRPNLPPYAPEQALQEQARAAMVQGVGASDVGQRAQYKLAAGIPLADDEIVASAARARGLVQVGGPGTTVRLDIPGMPTQVGSPYNFSPIGAEEYPSYQVAAAAAAARGPGWQVMPTGRGTFMLAPPPTEQQMKPAATPPPVPAGGAPPPATPPPVAAGGAPAAPRVATPPVPPPATTVTPTTAGGPPPTIATRTNNPGNIKDGPFARAQPGYLGQGPPATDGGNFAVFDSPESGHAAMGNLLQRPGYQGLPVAQALNRWSGGGYGADVALNAGVDPTRPMSSLSPDELRGLTGAMAKREGFQGALPAAAPARPPAAPPAAPPPPVQPVAAPQRPIEPTGTPLLGAGQVALPEPPPRVPAYMPPGIDRNALAPSVAVPAAPVGYAPPAPGGPTLETQIPTVRPPVPAAQVVPPPPAVAPTPPPPAPPRYATTPVAPPSVAPGTEVPVSRVTVTDQSGKQTTYEVPTVPSGDVGANMRLAGITDFRLADPQQIELYKNNELADYARKQATDADIARLRGTKPADQIAVINMLTDYRSDLDKLQEDFRSPEDRAKYIGWLRRPRVEWLSYYKSDPGFEKFVTDLAPFQYEKFDDEKTDLTHEEQRLLGGQLPTGREISPEAFEEHLQAFNDRVNTMLARRTAMLTMAPEQITPEWLNGFNRQMAETRAARRTELMAPPPAAPPPAPAAAPPVGAPPALQIFGDRAAQ